MEEIFQNIIMYNSINRNDSENVFDYVREENSNEIRHFSLQILIWGKGVVLGFFGSSSVGVCGSNPITVAIFLP